MLKGVNDSKEEIKAVVDFLNEYKYFNNFEGIDLLPYHKFGVGKYDQLDMVYPIEGEFSLSDEDLNRIEKWLDEEGLEVNIVKH